MSTEAEVDLLYHIEITTLSGRGSWIRTNDLQYPKLPRYQAALYPDDPRKRCRYTLKALPARPGALSSAIEERMRNPIAGRDTVFSGCAADPLENPLRQPA